MRITDIKLKNFRAFYGSHHLKLDKSGKNLMVYGENGSGKSSLYHALKMFLKASVAEVPIADRENIFISDAEKGSVEIELTLKESSTASSETKIRVNIAQPQLTGEAEVLIADANKIKAFFDYRSLLKTHLNHTGTVNIFQILVEDILSDAVNQFNNERLGDQWDEIWEYCFEYRQGVHIRKWLKSSIQSFNDGLEVLLEEIKNDANLFLEIFETNIVIDFDFPGVQYRGRRDLGTPTINLQISYCGEQIPEHQDFLNEARLSALAISLYLASIRVNPREGKLKLLVLDDLLIGLDMSNRLPLLKILKEHFEDDFQIIMTTYDKIWFEVVQNYFSDAKWEFVKVFAHKLSGSDFEMPVIKQKEGYLELAKHHLGNHDYKASAVYIRAEFERKLKSVCHSANLQVRYRENEKEVKADDYWNSVVDQTNIEESLVKEVETHRGTVMNPLSHDDLERPEFRKELEDTIAVVEKLKNANITKGSSIKDLKREMKTLKGKLKGKDKVIKKMSDKIKDLRKK